MELRGGILLEIVMIIFTPKQKKLIKEILLKKGFKCKSISDYEVEWDGERSYSPTIGFINNK